MARVRDILLRDTRANQPLPADVDIGILFYVTDENTTEQNDGTNWVTYADGGGTVTSSFVGTFLLMGA